MAHQYVPQSELLPHCDAVICHAGARSLPGALAAGVPVPLVPLGADHFANAAAAVRRGVAVALEGEVNARSVAAALVRVLSDPDLRRSAAEVRDEISAMPHAAAAAEGILAWLGERSSRG